MRLAEIPNALRDRVNRLRLRVKVRNDFAVVSNNCWGAGFYSDLGRAYNTPFVGTMIPPECYLRLLADFEATLREPLRFLPKSRYTSWEIRCPVAQIGDSEIHFMHYKSEAEAREKWTRRLERFPRDPAQWRFKFCDHHLDYRNREKTDAALDAFARLPHARKVCFVGRTVTRHAHEIPLPEFAATGRVPDGHALYRMSLRHFQAAEWLQGNSVRSR